MNKPYFNTDLGQLYNADCLAVLKDMPDDSIDCIVTDPPYGYSFMGKNWDTFNELHNPQGCYEREKGFKKLPRNKAGKGHAEFFIPIWQECLRVMKPGAFAFIMSSPRQDVLSRMICNLQDAGFITGFSSIYWTYASGFPKAQNISKAIDKSLGCEREVVGYNKRNPRDKETYGGDSKSSFANNTIEALKLTAPASPEAQSLDGSYGGFQPKPAIELILAVMKPLSEKTYMNQALKNGHGITWLDDGRIPIVDLENELGYRKNAKNYKTNKGKNSIFKQGGIAQNDEGFYNSQGRFPANLLVSDDVLNDNIFRHSAGSRLTKREARNKWGNKSNGLFPLQGGERYGDSGSFSRYFDLDKWWVEKIKTLPLQVQKVFPFLIVPKASKGEKNKGCEELEKKPVRYGDGRGNSHEVFNTKSENRKNPRNSPTTNHHPTVKPIKLMSYLITIGSRENDTVLDPFCGSGTTCISAEMLNRRWVGIEREEEYCIIARERINAVEKPIEQVGVFDKLYTGEKLKALKSTWKWIKKNLQVEATLIDGKITIIDDDE